VEAADRARRPLPGGPSAEDSCGGQSRPSRAERVPRSVVAQRGCWGHVDRLWSDRSPGRAAEHQAGSFWEAPALQGLTGGRVHRMDGDAACTCGSVKDRRSAWPRSRSASTSPTLPPPALRCRPAPFELLSGFAVPVAWRFVLVRTEDTRATATQRAAGSEHGRHRRRHRCADGSVSASRSRCRARCVRLRTVFSRMPSSAAASACVKPSQNTKRTSS